MKKQWKPITSEEIRAEIIAQVKEWEKSKTIGQFAISLDGQKIREHGLDPEAFMQALLVLAPFCQIHCKKCGTEWGNDQELNLKKKVEQ